MARDRDRLPRRAVAAGDPTARPGRLARLGLGLGSVAAVFVGDLAA